MAQYQYVLDYLAENNGSPDIFAHGMQYKARPGQAFCTAISYEDAEALRHTVFDPYYSTEPDALHKAIEYLKHCPKEKDAQRPNVR